MHGKLQNMLALIPARGGSKRLPRKNLRMLNGKPLIAYSVQAAIDAGISTVVVSTDDPEIAAEATRWGASVPFMRPAHLSSDTASSVDVVLHCLEVLRGSYEVVLLLQPTSPLRTAEDIVQSLELYDRTIPEAVVSVCETHLRPEWVFTVQDGVLKPPEVRGNRKDCHFFTVNGAIYVVRSSVVYDQKSLVPRHTVPFVMPKERSVDIDTEIDLAVAELMLRRRSS